MLRRLDSAVPATVRSPFAPQVARQIDAQSGNGVWAGTEPCCCCPAGAGFVPCWGVDVGLLDMGGLPVGVIRRLRRVSDPLPPAWSGRERD